MKADEYAKDDLPSGVLGTGPRTMGPGPGQGPAQGPGQGPGSGPGPDIVSTLRLCLTQGRRYISLHVFIVGSTRTWIG